MTATGSIMASSETWSSTLGLPDIEDWMRRQQFETTADVKIPPQLVDQVIGQDEAVMVIRRPQSRSAT